MTCQFSLGPPPCPHLGGNEKKAKVGRIADRVGELVRQLHLLPKGTETASVDRIQWRIERLEDEVMTTFADPSDRFELFALIRQAHASVADALARIERDSPVAPQPGDRG
ncbi:hypothetical protein [Nocardia abscessus]|uniref:Uncharacterized protein n=1 Tax=Nocardia abscessus TaxID=120957 RepID=A0ABS0CEL1_9NOCA|nr:hypothetical protein [Nocardia abscessus]MBF6228769.1 hypothetical protein [Nocardia abscessus]